MYFSGVQVWQGPPSAGLTSFSSAALVLGASLGASEYLDGIISEMFVIGSIPSNATLQNIRLYVASKYEIYIANTTGLEIPEYTQTGAVVPSPLSDVGGTLLAPGSMVVGGLSQQYTGGGDMIAPYLNPATLTVDGIFCAVATNNTQEHMLVTEDSANVLAIWNRAGFSAIRYLEVGGLECAAIGFSSASGGIFSGLNGNGASYWEASNFDNTAQAGCAVFVQTGQIGGGSDDTYKRWESLTNGNLIWYGLLAGSNTPPTILTLRPTGDLVGPAGISTSATGGFWTLPTCAGTPTGVPVGGEGSVVVDSTNHKPYVYLNGAWVEWKLA